MTTSDSLWLLAILVAVGVFSPSQWRGRPVFLYAFVALLLALVALVFIAESKS